MLDNFYSSSKGVKLKTSLKPQYLRELSLSIFNSKNMTTMEQYGSMEDEPIKVEDRETDLLFSTNDGSISTPLTIRYGKFITITAVIIALVGSFMLLAHSRQNGEQIPIFSDREG